MAHQEQVAIARLQPSSVSILLFTIGNPLQVLVRDNNVEQAMKVLKKKLQREGVFREMKLRKQYEKPSERKVREKNEAVRRARKLARKKMQREGLIPMTKKKAPRAVNRTTIGDRSPSLQSSALRP